MIFSVSHRATCTWIRSSIIIIGRGGRGGDSLLALWRVSNNVNCWSILFCREIVFIIITILVTEPPSIISIVILNSVPLERADVANMGGGDWRRGHPLNTQCALQCHGIQQTTLQTTADYSRLHCTSVYSSHSLVDEGSAWNTQVDALHTDSTQLYNIYIYLSIPIVQCFST